MIDLTDSAKDQLVKYFENNEPSPIRVYLAAGCGGPRLALALDEKKDNDAFADVKGFQFLVDKALLETVSPIEIDHTESGFIINSSLKVNQDGCSSCTSC
ncbi:IscA/HesB family protein [Desulfonatronovibrio hydrogenovorans]|uniref:IscA/HesB family protein n=1 Tax=Desulfonatronovibrio hydrogenovorans TaxID=53245 RepID=UPI00048B92B1|nr:IscA/HesB family protein [Desulfonatronovibrio hydrogenovorans]